MKRNLVGKILGKIKIFVQDFVPIRTALNGYTFESKKIYAVQRQYQLGASIRPLKLLHAARADKAGKGGFSTRQSGGLQGACVEKVHERARRLKFLQ